MILLFCQNLFCLSHLTLSFNPLRSKSMDWFLYDNGLRHENVKLFEIELIDICG